MQIDQCTASTKASLISDASSVAMRYGGTSGVIIEY